MPVLRTTAGQSRVQFRSIRPPWPLISASQRSPVRAVGKAPRQFNSMSQLLKKIVQDWEAETIYRSTTFRSSKNSSVVYTTTIYWGGSMTNPSITCTCPTAAFHRKICHHAEAVWNELSQFTKNDAVHHYEIIAKPWYRAKQQ
jgi:hypothetical protein